MQGINEEIHEVNNVEPSWSISEGRYKSNMDLRVGCGGQETDDSRWHPTSIRACNLFLRTIARWNWEGISLDNKTMLYRPIGAFLLHQSDKYPPLYYYMPVNCRFCIHFTRESPEGGWWWLHSNANLIFVGSTIFCMFLWAPRVQEKKNNRETLQERYTTKHMGHSSRAFAEKSQVVFILREKN